MKKKSVLTLILGTAATVALVYAAARALGGLDISVLLRSSVDWRLFAVAAVLFGAGQFVRAFVYPYGIDEGLTVGESCRIVLVGNMVNLLLPLRAGEGVRLAFFPPAYSAARRTWRIMLPGGVDVVAVLVLSLLAALLAGSLYPQAAQVLRIAGVALCAAAGLLLAAAMLVPAVQKWAQGFFTPGFWRMACWILLSWCAVLFSMWLALLALQFDPASAMRMAFAVFATTNIVAFIPSSPGGIGVFEYAVVLSLGFFGVSREPALAAAFLLHLVQYAALLPMGACAWFSGLVTARRALAVRKAL